MSGRRLTACLIHNETLLQCQAYCCNVLNCCQQDTKDVATAAAAAAAAAVIIVVVVVVVVEVQ